ncbi:cysteine protease inhibitor [Naegleria gruberi]|uniref:Cysteine protease inhibitor n=1 Tax=Naegleria gruberi TaxID=5762 RepID=D2VC71_NAEGR|nr:cysteine protease inhibitor [Naegleria gruberi]EFC45605.1 cysteine protease inhibitor [Naegleria gruberi]|eukprot:XP_002678349.1 cysteine protease inhibitor [Naegleria gruberi strain NEG-M]
MFQRSSTAILLLLIACLMMIGFTSAVIPGGFSHNKKPSAKRIAKFTSFLSSKLAAKYPTITQIIDIQQQVVAGVMYKVTALAIDSNGQEKTIKATIFEPLPHAIQAGQSKLQLKDVKEL